ncbi:hypothetical protein F4805DRAFT_477226 [Annulohypoxylon moriforme]|nr:hypothetical protein F4805DRAFT_477226 [Annulohypoxylon moriforme]
MCLISTLAKVGLPTFFFSIFIAITWGFITSAFSNEWSIAKFDVLRKNSLPDRLTSRAIPNQRLVQAFGIINSFTTVDRNVHERFIISAKSVILNMNPDKWSTFFTIADVAVCKARDTLLASQDSLPLAVTVRFVVFAAMIYQFFDVQLDETHFADANNAMILINSLWEHSKNLETARPELRDEQARLQTALERLLPNCFPCNPEKHPLNIIIPAYETMWRVVLLTYVSVGFRDVDPETAEQFREVVRNIPKYSTLEPKSKVMNTAINFAKEGLRLYPPTKRIHRNIPSGQNSSYNVKADVEWCHRHKGIWGPDADQYRPSRFQNCTANMNEAYMPFGAGKHRCPTASKFSYHAIIILVVVLAKRLGTKETGSKVVFNDPKLDKDLRKVLPSGRMDMENWVLEMNGTEWLGRAM